MSLSFKPRKELINEEDNGASSKSASSYTKGKAHASLSNLEPQILTKNEKYTVSTMPLGFLESNGLEEIYTPVLHSKTGFGLILTNDGSVHIWNFMGKVQLSSSTQISYKLFDLLPANSDTSLANYGFEFIANDMKLTPSLLILNKSSGEVFYFDDIQSTLTNAVAYSYKISLKHGEFIAKHEFITNLGLLVLTDSKHNKLSLISFKDSLGKILQNCQEQKLNDSSLASSSWNSLFNRAKNSEIRCVIQENFLNKTDKAITSLDAFGTLTQFIINRSSNYKNSEFSVYEPIVDSLRDFYPYTYNTTQFYSFQKITDEIFLVLSKVVADYNDGTQSSNDIKHNYVVSVVRASKSSSSSNIQDVNVLSTYVLKTVVEDFSSIKIFVDYDEEKTYFSAFITFDNAVVILQLSSKFNIQYSFQNKWEDIIAFKNSSSNSGFIYSKENLLFVNTYINQLVSINLQNTVEATDSTNLYINSFIKSHIEQAIFFNTASSNSPIQFNLPGHIELGEQDIENDLALVVDEVWNSKSSYLPAAPLKTNNTELILTYLQNKLNVFERLLSYISANFVKQITSSLKLSILYKYEILNCAVVFYSKLSSLDYSSLVTVGNKTSIFQIQENLDYFPELFTQFISNWDDKIASNPSDESLQLKFTLLIISTLYDTVFEKCESTYKYQVLALSPTDCNSSDLPWFASESLVSVINDFVLQYGNLKISENSENNEHFMKLIKILYYQCSQYKILLDSAVFQKSHLKWCDFIVKMHDEDHYRSLILILDFYKDLKGLVYTFDKLDEEMIPDSVYIDYLKKYGEGFIDELCKYFIDNTGNLSKLFRIFSFNQESNIKDIWTEYLNKNRDVYAGVAWIDDISHDSYFKASDSLYRVSKDQNKIQKFQNKQFELSVSKLALLLGSEEESSTISKNEITDRLVKIQIGLDELGAQKDLFNRLKSLDQDFMDYTELSKTSEFYKISLQLINILKKTSPNTTLDILNKSKYKDASEPQKHLDDNEEDDEDEDMKQLSNDAFTLIEADKSVQSSSILSLNQLIYLFTVLAKANTVFKDGYFCALKLLALSINDNEYETFKFYVGFIWRSMLLNAGEPENKTLIEYTLDKYFEQELYKQIPLPLTSDVYDTNTIPSSECIIETLRNISLNSPLEISTKDFIKETSDKISLLMNDFEKQNFIKYELPTLIDGINSKYENQVIIDYKSGKLQFM